VVPVGERFGFGVRNLLNPHRSRFGVHRAFFVVEMMGRSNTMHPNDDPISAPAANAPRATLRFVRTFLWILYGVGLSLLMALAVAPVWFGAGIASGAIAGLGAVALTYGIRRLVRNPWTRLGVSYAALAGVVAYLMIDEATVRRPLTLEAFAPTFPGGEESYEVFMRYGKQHPLGRDFRFQPSQKLYQGQGGWKPKDPQWSAWIATNRAELESGWAKLEPVRAWWSELNTFDRIADLTPPKVDAEIITFAPIRALTQHACAIASLQALDGNGDAAMETLLPILEVSRKLEPSARTLVRFMIARVAQKLALETAAFVLDTVPVSPSTRARLAGALTGGCAGPEGARYVVGMEYAWAMTAVTSPDFAQFLLEDEKQRWMRRCLTPLRPLVLNSRRTLNLYAELTAELQDLAARRGTADMDGCYKEFFAHQARVNFKNFGGTLLLTRMVPAYKKIVESYWTTEDLRTALHSRLQT
jgi:hypothetical protein